MAERATKLMADITADDLRQMLQDAIEDDFMGGESQESASDLDRQAMSSVWVVDIYPMSNRFVYRGPENDLYERGYSVDQNGTLTLVGDPVEVTRVTTYVPASGTQIAIGQFSDDGDDIYFEGEIFRAGEYPDKGVFATNEDCLNMAEAFNNDAPAMIQHTNTAFDKALAGYGLEHVEPRDGGSWLWGRAKLPGWVKSVLGKEVAVSVRTNLNDGGRPTKITELSIVDRGRINTARIAAAFADFAGKRNSGKDTKLIQDAHDALVALGATCIDTKGDGAKASMSHDHRNTEMATEKTVKEKLAEIDPAALEKAGLTVAEIEAQFDGGDSTRSTATGVSPEVEARIAQLEAESATHKNRTLQESAAKFADESIRQHRKALPAERDSLIDLYNMAALADGEGGVAKFSDTGDVAEGDNVKRLRDSIEKRQTLAVFAEAIPGQKPNDDTGGSRDEAAKERTYQGSPLGRAAAEFRRQREGDKNQ